MCIWSFPAGVIASIPQEVDHVTVLVDGPPQELLPTFGPAPTPHGDTTCRAGGRAGTAAVERTRVKRRDALRYRLVCDSDAVPGKKVFDVPDTKAESVVQPHDVGDALGWKAVSAVAGRLLTHSVSLPRGST